VLLNTVNWKQDQHDQLADVLKIQGIKMKLLEILPHIREKFDECKNHVWSKLRRCLKEEMQIKV
jgi:hypothetical protein